MWARKKVVSSSVSALRGERIQSTKMQTICKWLLLLISPTQSVDFTFQTLKVVHTESYSPDGHTQAALWRVAKCVRQTNKQHITFPQQCLSKCLTPLSSDAGFCNHWQLIEHQGGWGNERERWREGDQRNREGRNTRDSVQVRRIQLKWTSSEEEDEREWRRL